jgi:hypothetical protein
MRRLLNEAGATDLSFMRVGRISNIRQIHGSCDRSRKIAKCTRLSVEAEDAVGLGDGVPALA